MDGLGVLDQVRHAPALRHLQLRQLEQLVDRAYLSKYLPGEELMAEGERATEIQLLLEGRVVVERRLGGGGREPVAERKAIDWVGEAALLESGERIATVVAKTAVRVLRLRREDLLAELEGNRAAFLEMIRILLERLRESDTSRIRDLGRSVADLRSSNKRLALENRQLRAAVGDELALERFIGSGAAARAVREAALRAADSDLPVLLLGETGTGKELIARGMHASGPRAGRPFVALNCAHLTESLLESELFGHARGAFTGASESRAGLVEVADGGSLLLDEIADMPRPLQGALLRFLELGEFRRVGETRIRRSRVRVIAATHRDLDAAVGEGSFRTDLLYRLDVIRIAIPPLREHMEDLSALVGDALARAAERLGVAPLKLSRGALEELARHDFPGNVRELINEIERLYVALEPGSLVSSSELSSRIAGPGSGPPSRYREALRDFKRRLVERSLREAEGNRTRAASLIGVNRANFARMMRDLGIADPGRSTTRRIRGQYSDPPAERARLKTPG